MAVTKATDLALAKNETATEFVVAMLWQLLERAIGSTPLEDSALRMSRNHVRELAELHGLDQDKLCPKSKTEGENGTNGNGRVSINVEPDRPHVSSVER